MRRWHSGLVGTALALLLAMPSQGRAFDAEQQFARGTTVFSLQVGGGVENNVERHESIYISDVAFVNVLPRLTYLPLDPMGPGPLRGALEVGLEGWYQVYVHPDLVTAQGLKGALRYNFLSLGRFVPYLEVTAGAGGTNLKVEEIRSTFTFVLEAGAGASYFVAPNLAVSAGYRFQHLSNGHIETPNRGINSDTGVVGVSIFFH